MENSITWSFEGQDVKFVSTPERFERNKIKTALSMGLELDHKVIIHGNTTPNSSDADSIPSIDGNSDVVFNSVLSEDDSDEDTEQETI